MISVALAVKEIIEKSPFLKEALTLGILNHSALARLLKGKVEKILLKEVSLGSLIVAISRAEKKLRKEREVFEEKLRKIFGNKIDLVLRTDLVEYSFPNSQTLIKKLFQFFEAENFFVLSKGTLETTIVFHSKSENLCKKLIEKEKPLKIIKNLAAISIRLPEDVLKTPGVYHFFLSALAFEGINVVETFSTFRELTLLLEGEKITQAFEILKDLFSSP